MLTNKNDYEALRPPTFTPNEKPKESPMELFSVIGRIGLSGFEEMNEQLDTLIAKAEKLATLTAGN